MNSIIIDTGSYSTKAGVYGENLSRTALFRSVIGRSQTGKQSVVGDAAIERRLCDELVLKHVVEEGQWSDMGDMEKLWKYAFSELRVENASEHRVLLSEALLNPMINREKATEIMFETFRVPSLCVASTSVLSLFSAGLVTGLVVECGHGVSQSVAIHEGSAVEHSVVRLGTAGNALTDDLKWAVEISTGLGFSTIAEREIINKIKKTCYVAVDGVDAESFSSPQPIEYVLPDGQVIKIGSERYTVPEALFRSSQGELGASAIGLHRMSLQSIENCDASIQEALFGNVVLAGGSTMFPGISKRMSNELRAMAPTQRIQIIAENNRDIAAWTGARLLCELPYSGWMSRAGYAEIGCKLVHDICPTPAHEASYKPNYFTKMSPPLGTKHEPKSTKENLQRGANQNTSPMQAHVVRLQRQSFAEAVKATTTSSVAAVTSSAVATSSKIVTSSAISQSPTLATSTSSKVEPSIGSKSPLSTLLNNEQSLTDMMKLNLPNLGVITTEDLEQRKLKIQSQYGPLPPIDQNGNVAPKRPQSLVNNNNNNNNDNNNNNNNNNTIVPQSTKMAQLAMEAKSVRDRQIQSTATPIATSTTISTSQNVNRSIPPVKAATNTQTLILGAVIGVVIAVVFMYFLRILANQ